MRWKRGPARRHAERSRFLRGVGMPHLVLLDDAAPKVAEPITFEEKDQQKMAQIPASSMESLQQVAKILAEQSKKRNEFLKDGVKTVPVKDEVLEKLASVVGGDELDEIM